ncbi:MULTISPECIES: thiamine phosphate synthase [unclassified Arthrobacter]|uniref:thiamine phosphate synthase n=1 Tax=unclassified Arthrobacter TaxID=235627 RepID=UPI001D132AD1|nr:thiamine phosphate synthase [Arthrobacter sp. zg-Y20]MCC9176864.1 thiamine phosphate synthase [Arthrobacter sp. zg-Y750]
MNTASFPDSGRLREGARNTGIYLVTDTLLCGARGVTETVRAAVAGGIRTVQVREKQASAADFYQLVLAVASAIGDRALVLVDDRVDIYLAARTAGAEVHGVHVGQSDLPAGAVRRLVGPDAVVGLTANTERHLAAVGALPAGTVDYLGAGVIRPTSTKPDHPEPLGISGFQSFAASSPLPCVAIGGIQPADVVALRAAGASGIAVVSAVCAAVDPRRAAEELVAAWNR